MSTILDSLRRVVADLDGMGRPVALVGGLAVSVRAEPRFTRDLDLAVAVASDREAEQVVFGLQNLGYRLRMAVEQEAVGRLATARMLPPGGTDEEALADLLFASSGIEPEIVARAETLEIVAGLQLPVATVGHLIAMKVLAHDPRRRPKDGLDLTALLDVAQQADLAEARDALALITQRGFHRGKDLNAELEDFLRRARSSQVAASRR